MITVLMQRYIYSVCYLLSRSCYRHSNPKFLLLDLCTTLIILVNNEVELTKLRRVVEAKSPLILMVPKGIQKLNKLS